MHIAPQLSGVSPQALSGSFLPSRSQPKTMQRPKMLDDNEQKMRDTTRRAYGTLTPEVKAADARARYAADPEPKRQRGREWYASLSTEQKRERAHRNNLKVKYGISVEDYDRLWVDQGECCGACGAVKPRGGRWHLDHDHDTKAIRGILCANCNLALGQVGESIDTLLGLVAYVQRSR